MTIRVTALIRRRPDLSREDFLRYWSTDHVQIFTSLKSVQDNLVKYNQFHVLKPETDRLTELGLPIANFDAAAEFIVDKLDDLITLFSDIKYQEVIAADEPNFLDRSSIQILVGEDHVQFERAGKATA